LILSENVGGWALYWFLRLAKLGGLVPLDGPGSALSFGQKADKLAQMIQPLVNVSRIYLGGSPAWFPKKWPNASKPEDHGERLKKIIFFFSFLGHLDNCKIKTLLSYAS
jgi:hypothetical protein